MVKIAKKSAQHTTDASFQMKVDIKIGLDQSVSRDG